MHTYQTKYQKIRYLNISTDNNYSSTARPNPRVIVNTHDWNLSYIYMWCINILLLVDMLLLVVVVLPLVILHICYHCVTNR